MSFVEVKGLSITYPGREEPILSDLDLSIHQGEFVVLTGKSGCGKSTLGKALAGFLFQDPSVHISGSVHVHGIDMTKAPLYEASERVAYVQQNPEDQFCTLTVADEIAFGLENRCLAPEDIEDRTTRALALVKGTHLRNRNLSTLSGGEKQKIAIAAMFALSPDVLILDEPTSNLDPAATLQVFETLNDLRHSESLTVIIIEHKLSQLSPLKPRLVVIEDGHICTYPTINHFDAYLSKEVIHLPGTDQNKPQPLRCILSLDQISVDLDQVPILSDISLKIHRGELIALMGRNGSGKSTLLQTMIGFHRPASGSLFGFGQNLKNMKVSEMVDNIGFLFQNPDHQLFQEAVWDEAIMTLRNLNRLTADKKHLAQAWLKAAGLGERKQDHPQKLSYGEKRRLNLIAILLHQPELLLIDEFLIGQDMAHAHAWLGFLRNYADSGHAILFVNHNIELTEKYCDRVIFMEQGQILLDEPIAAAAPGLSERYFLEEPHQHTSGTRHA
jgi:energy-coupling factor transport system ATP-binding protein